MSVSSSILIGGDAELFHVKRNCLRLVVYHNRDKLVVGGPYLLNGVDLCILHDQHDSNKDKFIDMYGRSILIDNEFNESALKWITSEICETVSIGLNMVGGYPYPMYVVDFNTGAYVEKETSAGGHKIIDGAIYVREFKKGVVKYDFELNQVWLYEAGKIFFGSIHSRCYPQDYRDAVILYLGENDNRKRDEGEVVALHKHDGSLKWSFVVEKAIDNCLVINDHVYLAYAGTEMIVLSADTGEVILRQQTEFKAKKNSSLWAVGDYLLFLSCQDFAIGVYTKSGEKIGVIRLPEGYSVRPCSVPDFIQGKIYIQIGAIEQALVPVLYGLLIIDPDELASGDYHIEFEPQPDMTTQAVADPDGTEHYEVTIHHDSFDDVLRFGEIELKRIVSVHGKQIFPSSEVNLKFAGRVIYNIDTSRLQDPDTDKLAILVERVMGLVNGMDMKPGTGKGEINVEWRLI